MRFKVKLALSIAAASAALFVFFGSQDAVAISGSEHWICHHNGTPYTMVTGTQNCPDSDPAWNPVKDQHEGLVCFDQAGNEICPKERHIDCEYAREPGGL